MASTGYEALRNGAAWIDYSSRGKVRVTGEDAGRLLHAMSTNHIQSLDVGRGLYAFFLNDKGRIVSDATIFRLADSFWLDTEPELGAKLHQLLDKYIIADDAVVEDESALWFSAGVEGPESAAAMQRLQLSMPGQPLQIVEQPWGYVARLSEGFRIWARNTMKDRLVESGIPKATAEDQNIVRIENGVPRYGDDISERYLVQETRLMHAVHSSKGCYLGQEIVERVRSRGQVHRLLASLRIDGVGNFPPGTKLLSGGAPAGEITSSAFSSALNQTVALGYVRTEAVDQKATLTVAEHEPPVIVRILG